MTWIKLDDQFFRNPKSVQAGKDGRLLYLAGMCYAGSSRTDGFIPENAVRIIAAEAEVARPNAVVQMLVKTGLWTTVEGGYEIAGYLENNRSSAKIEADRVAAVQRASANRSRKVRANSEQSSDEVREPDTDTDTDISVPDGTERERAQTAPPKPIPKARPHRLPADWQPGERELSWAITAGYPEPLIRTETDKFRDHFTASGKTQVDWPAAWRNWLRRSAEFAPKVTPIRAGKQAVDGNLSNEQLEALMRGGAL